MAVDTQTADPEVETDITAGGQTGQSDDDIDDSPEARGDYLEETKEEVKDTPLEKYDPEALAEIAGDGDETPKFVPHGRFNQVWNENKALREELERLKPTQPQEKTAEPSAPPQTEAEKRLDDLNGQLDAKESALLAAIQDGDADAARQLQKDLRAINRTVSRIEAEEAAKVAIREEHVRGTAEQEKGKALDLAGQMIKDNPFLGEGGDADAIEMFVLARDHAVKGGATLVDAMQTALAKVTRAYGHLLKTETPPEKKEGDAKANLAKKLDAARRQPPRPSSIGTGARAEDGKAKDVSAMSDSEFNALSEAELRRLRGDDL